MKTLLHGSVLAVCCLALLSCGQVGEPLPPLLKIPARVEGFEARQFEDRVLFRWNPPLLTTEGAALEDLDRVIIYAVEIARDTPPATPEALAPYFRVVAESVDDSSIAAAPVSDRFGQLTGFAIQAVTEKGKRSPWSALEVLDLTRPPAPPQGLRAAARDFGVRLEWDPADGATAYVVERAEEDASLAPIGETAETAYDDRSAAFGTAYRYRLRARADSPTGPAPGAASEAIEITPSDVFPPAAPTGLRAIRTPQSVELSWEVSPESDLAGYRVELNGAALHEGLLAAPTFSHAGAPAPAAYSIVAVDDNGNAGQPGVIEVE